MKCRKEKHRRARKHGWSSRPGCKIFVADRSALRFDYPADWIGPPDPDSVKLRDREPTPGALNRRSRGEASIP